MILTFVTSAAPKSYGARARCIWIIKARSGMITESSVALNRFYYYKNTYKKDKKSKC